jgi:hypothetical protein
MKPHCIPQQGRAVHPERRRVNDAAARESLQDAPVINKENMARLCSILACDRARGPRRSTCHILAHPNVTHSSSLRGKRSGT